MRVLFVVVVVSVLLMGCKPSSSEKETIDLSQVPEIQLALATTILESDSVLFQRISEIVSDSSGNIILADQMANKIYQFDADGNFLNTIGRDGEGPGEFRSILYLFMDSKNRLFVGDISLDRTSIFEKNESQWQFLQNYSTGAERYSVIAASPTDDLVLRKSPFQTPTYGTYWYEHVLGYGNLQSDSINAELVRFKERGQLVDRNGWMNGIPFGPETLVATSPDGFVYLLWNETFNLEIYDSHINPIDTIRLQLPKVEVTDVELNQYAERMSEQFQSLLMQHAPITKPVARKLEVDPLNRIWIQMYTDPEYLVINQAGNLLGTFNLSDSEVLMHVDKNRIYTTSTDTENGIVVSVYDYVIK
jgi:hypothetical protein